MSLTRIDSAFLDLDALGGIDFDVQSGVPTLKVDATNHRVGIGINSPTQKLDVGGSVNISSGSNYLINGSQMSTANIAENSSYLYFTNARAVSAITGSALDMGSNNITTTGRILFSNLYSAEGDLPSASTYHGMFAHVHGTGKAYYSHAGAWIKLLDENGGSTGSLNIDGNVSSTTQFSGFDALRIHNANGSAFGITADMYFTAGTATANRGAAIGAEYASSTGNDLYFATNPGAVTNSDTLLERLRITSAGNVGIKTSAPAAPLHVDSDNAYGSLVLSRDGGVSGRKPFGLGISGTNDDHLRISSSSDTTGANAFANPIIEITAGGLVGIGTVSPDQLIHINKAAGTTLFKASTQANSTIGFEIEKTGSTTQSWRIVDGQTVNGALEFYDVTNSTTRMIVRSGKIGIGESNPGTTLHVKSTDASSITQILDTGNAQVSLVLRNSTSTGNNIQLNANGNDFRILTDAEERLRIASDGDIEYKYNDADTATEVGATQVPHGLRIYNTNNTLGRLAGISFAHGQAGTANAGIFHETTNTNSSSTGCLGDLTFWTKNSGVSNMTEKLRITSGGLIDISGGIQVSENITPTSGAGLELFREGGGGGQVQAFDRSNSAWLPLILKGSTQSFHASGSERLHIAGNGQVLVGSYATHSSIHGNFEVNGNDGINISNANRTGTNGVQWRLIPHNGGGSVTNLRLFEGAGGTEVLNITKNGEIGIGNTSPSCKLLVARTTAPSAYASVTPSIANSVVSVATLTSSEAANSHATIQLNVSGGSQNRVCSISAVAQSATNRNADLAFCTDNGGSRAEAFRITASGDLRIAGDEIDFAGSAFITAKGSGNLTFRTTNSYTPRLTILNNGNIGINDGSPSYVLDIVDGNNRAYFWQGPDSTMGLYMHDNTNHHVAIKAYGDQLRFLTTTSSGGNPTPKMTITTNGNVGIGTTSPGSTLHVSGGRFMVNSDPSGEGQHYQVVQGYKSIPTSNSYVELAYVGHSHSIEVQFVIKQGTSSWIYGGAHGKFSMFTTYGSTSGQQDMNQRRFAMNGGNITGDATFDYLNSGGAGGSYLLRVAIPFSSNNAAVNISYVIKGLSSHLMYALS